MNCSLGEDIYGDDLDSFKICLNDLNKQDFNSAVSEVARRLNQTVKKQNIRDEENVGSPEKTPLKHGRTLSMLSD